MFINCVVIELNNYDHDYKSYRLSLIYSITISCSITSAKSTIYDMIPWIKQYVNDFNDTID